MSFSVIKSHVHSISHTRDPFGKAGISPGRNSPRRKNTTCIVPRVIMELIRRANAMQIESKAPPIPCFLLSPPPPPLFSLHIIIHMNRLRRRPHKNMRYLCGNILLCTSRVLGMNEMPLPPAITSTFVTPGRASKRPRLTLHAPNKKPPRRYQ
jgi:hypothetical protein